MCVSSWGRSTYARVLIEVSAENDLKDELVVAIPVGKDRGHTLATISIEYEWKPPRCSTCLVFAHTSDNCPTLPKETPVAPNKDNADGFTVVQKKKSGKANQNQKKKQIEGIRLTKFAFNLQYRKVDKGESSKKNDVMQPNLNSATDKHTNVNKSKVNITTTNSFSALSDNEDTEHNASILINEDSDDEEVDEELIMDDRIGFMGAHAIFKPYRNSNHSPSLLCIPTATVTKLKPFKFFNILTKHIRFLEVVHNHWNNDISGFLMFRVVKKLKCMKKPLRKLLIDKGNLHLNVVRLRDDIDQVQSLLDKDSFNANLRVKEATCVAEFNQVILDEERFLKQKAKIFWLKERDANSAYFHKSVKGRINRSRIDVVMNGDGILFANENVPAAFVAHYEMFLGQADVTNVFNDTNLFNTCLDEQVALNMVRNVSDREVKEALFSIGDDKSPGPDGYTAAFFKEAWTIVGDEDDSSIDFESEPEASSRTDTSLNCPNPMLAIKGNHDQGNNGNQARDSSFDIVQIPLSNRENLDVHGVRLKGNLKQLKTMKVNEPKLEDISVVREFPGVFSKDLSGLPPSREVEFHIDLILGAMPVATSPYHLAPTKIQELSNQLKEL
nr:hypothetical protein [Tanacetum cinerariifolium]